MAARDILTTPSRRSELARLTPGISSGAVTDVMLLQAGVRSLIRLSCAVEEAEAIGNSLRLLGLHTRRWSGTLEPVRSLAAQGDAGYVVASRPLEADGRKFRGRTFLFVASDQDLADLAEGFAMDDAVLGALLGYPDCCIRAFSANRTHYMERLHPAFAASGSPPMPFWANTAADAFGWRLISHFPCSAQCKTTRDIALTYWKALASADPAHAVSTLAHLRTVVLSGPTLGLAYGSPRRDRAGTCRVALLGASAAWIAQLDGQREIHIDSTGCVSAGRSAIPDSVSVFDFSGGADVD